MSFRIMGYPLRRGLNGHNNELSESCGYPYWFGLNGPNDELSESCDYPYWFGLNGPNDELSESCDYPFRSDSMDIIMSYQNHGYPYWF